jgi:hypothetical protein
MTTRTIHALALLGLAALSASGAAQQADPADVTFDVPINLTRLPNEITKIKVACEVTSGAIEAGYPHHTLPQGRRTGELEIPVSQGQVVATAQVVVSISSTHLDNPSGKQASYECRLLGFHAHPHNAWHDFQTVPQSDSVCRLTPKPAPFTGNFVW